MGFGKLLRAFLRLAPCAAACAFAGPALPAPAADEATLDVRSFNAFSSAAADPGESRWTLVGAPPLALEKQAGACCEYLPAPTRSDSLSHVGIRIEASRGFSVEVGVYSNLGDFVDRLAFSVPQSQFEKLEPGSKSNTRVLRVLWRNQTQGGRLAGTGAYVLKTRVTLNASAQSGALTRTDYKIVALLRTR